MFFTLAYNHGVKYIFICREHFYQLWLLGWPRLVSDGWFSTRLSYLSIKYVHRTESSFWRRVWSLWNLTLGSRKWYWPFFTIFWYFIDITMYLFFLSLIPTDIKKQHIHMIWSLQVSFNTFIQCTPCLLKKS